MSRETTAILLARIEERLKLFYTTNDKEHKSIISKIDELCGRVNHQITSMETSIKSIDERIKTLEISKVALESKYKGRMELYKWISIGLGIIVSIITLCHLAGLF